MKSIKNIFLLCSVILISALLMAAAMPDTIVGKWRYVKSEKERMEIDSALKTELQLVDTITKFPGDLLAMKEEFALMDAVAKAGIRQEIVDMLIIEDLEEWKSKVKEHLIEVRREEDSLDEMKPIIYNFRNDKVVEVYAANGAGRKDTSLSFIEDIRQSRVFLFANPKSNFSEDKDTLGFSVLHLSIDSLSVKFDPVNDSNAVEPIGNKIMNFKAYKD